MKAIVTGAALGLALGLALTGSALADSHGYGGERGDEDSGPRGSYRETCRDIRVDGDDLQARCRERDGDWRRSELENYSECRGDIFNDDGRLKCRRHDRDDDGDRSQDRGYHDDDRAYSQITLYKDSRYRGSARTFNRDTPDLHSYSYADTASSAYVQGGAWELCTRPYYHGRCVTVDDNVENFDRLGVNDRVESLRRVR